jgi:hypothetical protein
MRRPRWDSLTTVGAGSMEPTFATVPRAPHHVIFSHVLLRSLNDMNLNCPSLQDAAEARACAA